ncbi:hypothetical protein SUGI_1004670 [Cryptomeria japonica]|uniref:alpha carbonic anhydrase 7 n=1 Tax=Cryptomeria japonica TaxID=3369 RepID=UPI0024147230|nr:alpha carbonic anhydrase 7 [Cryptomeria japonica]GLJ47577.1 hypothetical protein SUGI_1004670 [Cryptomeria japonica]
MDKMFYAFAVLFFLALEMGFKSATEGVEFDYSGARGPSHWGDLKEEWKTCGHGRHQSPIDIVERNVEIYPNLGQLHKSYKAANASLKNRGHDIMVRWAEGAGTIHVDGTNFTLLQCHWHSPAEHTIHGRRYPLEIHLVHQTDDNRTVVIGILYEYGRQDPFLSELMDQISALSHHMEAGAEETLGIIDPKHIKLGSRKYYRYTGSLTTPPCTEGVIWIIVDKVRTVSRDQVRKLAMAVHDGLGKNSRPTQLENGRVVELYTPRHGISKHI